MASGAAVRNNVQVYGPEGGPVLVFAHGFGTDQTMWGRILPWFTDRYRVVLLDHVGSGGSDQSVYDSAAYSTLDAYVDDLMEVCSDLELADATLIGHSVGSMMAVSAAARDQRRRFGRLVLLTASPSYLDHPEDGYVGGFTRADLDDVFESLDANYVVWPSKWRRFT
jgi:sigma-B regulation protein RsbQ